MAQKTALVTGTTKGGIGDYLARDLHKRGFRVFATARTPSKGEFLKEMGMEVILLDVTNSETIRAAAAEVSTLTGGKLDLLVNNSGVGYHSALLDVDLAAARAMFDVNLFGLLEMIQVFSPLLIASKGRIVNIGSIVSKVPVPFQGIYNASKAALEQMSAQLRVELKPFGITVIHIVTGGIKTPFFDHAEKAELPENSAYKPAQDKVVPWLTGEAQLPQQRTMAERFAKAVIDNAVKRSPNTCMWSGYGTWQLWAITSFLWRNSTDIVLHIMGWRDLSKDLSPAKKP